jgi:hypothetical protein
MQTSNPILEAALAYAKRGWHVFPTRNKIPTTRHGLKDATTDPEQIKKWFANPKDMQISIATGDNSKLFVLDLDNKNGVNGIQAYIDKYGELPKTLQQRTPNNGMHLLFTYSPTKSFEPRNTKDRLGKGIETKGNGGSVVIAPSKGYMWDCSIKQLLPVPPEIIKDLAPEPQASRPAIDAIPCGSAYAQKTLGAIVKDMETTEKGGRNIKLNALAYRIGRLTAKGILSSDAIRALTEAAIASGLDSAQAEKTAQSGYTAGLKKG